MLPPPLSDTKTAAQETANYFYFFFILVFICPFIEMQNLFFQEVLVKTAA